MYQRKYNRNENPAATELMKNFSTINIQGGFRGAVVKADQGSSDARPPHSYGDFQVHLLSLAVLSWRVDIVPCWGSGLSPSSSQLCCIETLPLQGSAGPPKCEGNAGV
jgi:hypothetical protein